MSFRSAAHIFFLLVVTFGAVMVIRNAMEEPFVAWQQVNQVRAADVQDSLQAVEQE